MVPPVDDDTFATPADDADVGVEFDTGAFVDADVLIVGVLMSLPPPLPLALLDISAGFVDEFAIDPPIALDPDVPEIDEDTDADVASSRSFCSGYELDPDMPISMQFVTV